MAVIPPDENNFSNPIMLDMALKQAIMFGWHLLPEDKRSFEELEKMMRLKLDRAMQNVREDFDGFASE